MSRSRYPYELRVHEVDYGMEIQVEDLEIDEKGQRGLNKVRAKAIAENLVPEAIGSIIVSQRDDERVFIVDGYHRWWACKEAGIPTMVAEIHYGLSPQEEAILFLIKNRESSKPNAGDEYKVGLTAGLPLFTETDRVVKDHGLEVGSSSTNSIGAIAGLLRVSDTWGADVLSRVLTVAEAAWGRTQWTWDGMLLGGLGMFIGKHSDDINDSELARKLARAGNAQKMIQVIHSQASLGGLQNSGTGSRVATAYRVILVEWNKGRRKAKIAA